MTVWWRLESDRLRAREKRIQKFHALNLFQSEGTVCSNGFYSDISNENQIKKYK